MTILARLWEHLGVTGILALALLWAAMSGGILAALTVRKRLLRRISELESKASETTEKLELAQRANLAKGEFLASMSHEMRTPMDNIKSFAELALKTDLSPLQREYLDRLLNSADWLKHVLSDVLDFSRLEASALELENKEFSPIACVHSAIKMVEASAAKKNLELSCKLHPGVPAMVRGDSSRLRQILVNLLDNAIRFTTTGSIVLTVAVESESPDKVSLVMSVADTGIGIAPDKQKIIFEPFRGYQRRDGNAAGGTGLGLSICKKLTEMMGGNIEVQSHVGAGTTFRFTVSFGRIVVCEQKPEEMEILAKLSFKRLGILIADENALNRRLMAKFFEAAGHQVSPASTGKEALDVYCTDIFDLVLVSPTLPDMSCEAVTRSLRELECEGTQTQIYGLKSESDLPGDASHGGLEGWVSKPAQFEELIRITNAVAKNREVFSAALG